MKAILGHVRFAFTALVAIATFVPQLASARGERVMGAATEGAALRVKYLEKMEKLDLERKQCRKDIESIVQPQLALMDELGLAGDGPARALKDEGLMHTRTQKVAQLQAELMRLGKLLNQSKGAENSETLRRLQAFEQRMSEYSVAQRGMESHATAVLARSEKAVNNFVPFAKAVLKIKRSEACQGLFTDLRSNLPLGMEQALLKNRSRVKQQIAAVKSSQQTFAIAASRFMERFKSMRQVAGDVDSDSSL